MKKLFVFLVSLSVGLAVLSVDYTPVTSEKGAQAVQITTTTNAVDATEFTPVFVGQMLIGSVSNDVYVAEDLTTNGWIQLSN